MTAINYELKMSTRRELILSLLSIVAMAELSCSSNDDGLRSPTVALPDDLPQATRDAVARIDPSLASKLFSPGFSRQDRDVLIEFLSLAAGNSSLRSELPLEIEGTSKRQLSTEAQL